MAEFVQSRSPAIRVRNAHVVYRVFENPRLKISDGIRQGTLKRRVRRRIHAVRGVNLTIDASESVALVGGNGAGKSTLLRAIAGLQPLDAGSVQVASPPRLLGVQAIMNASWTGRQSIETGLIALGLSRTEAKERANDVARFARLAETIDLPVSTYSSPQGNVRSVMPVSSATSRNAACLGVSSGSVRPLGKSQY